MKKASVLVSAKFVVSEHCRAQAPDVSCEGFESLHVHHHAGAPPRPPRPQSPLPVRREGAPPFPDNSTHTRPLTAKPSTHPTRGSSLQPQTSRTTGRPRPASDVLEGSGHVPPG